MANKVVKATAPEDCRLEKAKKQKDLSLTSCFADATITLMQLSVASTELLQNDHIRLGLKKHVEALREGKAGDGHTPATMQ